MKTVEYEIGTGSKSDFYTLWKITTIDLRPRDNDGNILSEFKLNAVGRNMYYHIYISFVQNLGKTVEHAQQTLDKLGIVLSHTVFDFDLKHYTKPSLEAFGAKLKFKKDKWFAIATTEFFECWKANKEQMKKYGWSCWKYQDRIKNDVWYMGCKLNEQS